MLYFLYVAISYLAGYKLNLKSPCKMLNVNPKMCVINYLQESLIEISYCWTLTVMVHTNISFRRWHIPRFCPRCRHAWPLASRGVSCAPAFCEPLISGRCGSPRRNHPPHCHYKTKWNRCVCQLFVKGFVEKHAILRLDIFRNIVKIIKKLSWLVLRYYDIHLGSYQVKCKQT